jgi:ribose transport system substrate-binding protein
MRRATTLPLIGLAVWLAAGCGGDGGGGPDKGAKAKRTLGVSVLTMTNPFFKVIGDTITEEAGKHGYEVTVVSGDQDPIKQDKQVEDFITRKVSAIVLCPCNSVGVGPAIIKANEAGIPVFTADIACTAKGAKVVCHIATDNYDGGRKALEAVAEALGDAGGKVVVLDFKAVESCLQRVQGFKDALKGENAARAKSKRGAIVIAAELPGEGQKDQGYKAAADALEAHPDLGAIFAINDPSALGARAALERAEQNGQVRQGQVKIVGFDGQPEGKKAVRDGKLYADPIQFPDKIARETVNAIVRYFEGDRPPREILIPTALYRQADALKELK